MRVVRLMMTRVIGARPGTVAVNGTGFVGAEGGGGCWRRCRLS
jgi:hypothetical protein